MLIAFALFAAGRPLAAHAEPFIIAVPELTLLQDSSERVRYSLAVQTSRCVTDWATSMGSFQSLQPTP